MIQRTTSLSIATVRQGLVEITDRITGWTSAQALATGMLTLFCRHTSASLLIQENAARGVRVDIENYFTSLAPENPALYVHHDEGPDDMPAHLRTALTQTHLAIPLMDGALMLGHWQGIFLFEHRRMPHTRCVAVHLMGER